MFERLLFGSYLYINTNQIKASQTIADIYEIENNDISPLINNTNKHYKKEIKKDNKKITINLSYQYTPEEFKQSRTLNQCFTHSIFLDSEDNYYIKLYDGYICGYDEDYNVKMRIKTDYKVIQQNADMVQNNMYMWSWKSTDKGLKEIIFQVSKTEKIEETQEEGNVLIMASIAIVTGALLIFIFYKIIQKFLDYRFQL